MPQQVKGLQGQNNVNAEGSVLGHQCSPGRQSRKVLPRVLHQLPGARAYKAKVLRWCLLVVPGEATLGFCGKVSLGSEPSFIVLLGVRPLGRFPPPKSDRVGLGTADSPFRTCFLTADNAKACRLPWKLCFHLSLLNSHLLSLSPRGWVTCVGLSEAGNATLPSSPTLIDCFPMIDVYSCTPFSESERGGDDQKSSKRRSQQTSGPVGATHRCTLVQQRSVTSRLRCHSRGLQGRSLLTLGWNHGGENFNILITAAVDLMHGLSLLPCRVSGSRWPLSGALFPRFPKPVWFWDHCAGPQKTDCLWLSRQSPPQHLLIPSVFFFF